MEFKAKIKPGSRVWIDHYSVEWSALSPEFDVTRESWGFKCVAPGYGVLGGASNLYGNGAVHVYKMDDLIITDRDRFQILKDMKSEKQNELRKKLDEAAKLSAEIAALH